MHDLDPSRLAETLQRILNDASSPRPDRDGWVAIEEVCVVASAELHVKVEVDHVRMVSRRARRLEVRAGRIRLMRRGPRPILPDILFHATTAEQVRRIDASGQLNLGGRKRIYLSDDETQAWRAAHRLDGEPAVLVVDTLRARRSGVRFQRSRGRGLFQSTPIPRKHLLNLREGYGEQWSAGGIPVRRFPDGSIRMALIQVTRRSGTTWEVAKGKLELGESPEQAAIRETQEEMGVEVPFRMVRHVGDVRYGFLAPGGLPRLKTIFLYLIEPLGPMGDFAPSEREGIGAVRWFLPDDACRAVTHTSLKPLMWRARDMVKRYGIEPSARFHRAAGEEE